MYCKLWSLKLRDITFCFLLQELKYYLGTYFKVVGAKGIINFEKGMRSMCFWFELFYQFNLN